MGQFTPNKGCDCCERIKKLHSCTRRFSGRQRRGAWRRVARRLDRSLPPPPAHTESFPHRFSQPRAQHAATARWLVTLNATAEQAHVHATNGAPVGLPMVVPLRAGDDKRATLGGRACVNLKCMRIASCPRAKVWPGRGHESYGGERRCGGERAGKRASMQRGEQHTVPSGAEGGLRARRFRSGPSYCSVCSWLIGGRGGCRHR